MPDLDLLHDSDLELDTTTGKNRTSRRTDRMVSKQESRPQILIVDDEAPMRHMLRMVLERDGYAAFTPAEVAAEADTKDDPMGFGLFP